ncbi:hypothetical protein AB0J28_30380 [Streptosporangium canum]|uniref:hypothetical protein n=1 Tax=Streptosporangium canum TaxID=324952 RepID=UPI00341C33FB
MSGVAAVGRGAWQWDDAERDGPRGAMAPYRQVLARDGLSGHRVREASGLRA